MLEYTTCVKIQRAKREKRELRDESNKGKGYIR